MDRTYSGEIWLYQCWNTQCWLFRDHGSLWKVKTMLEDILNGLVPSEVFRTIIKNDPSIGNVRLAELLGDEFINLSSEAQQLVWHWKGPGRNQGLSDADLDALLGRLLSEAGYLKHAD